MELRTQKVKLHRGLLLGDVPQVDAVVRESTANDVMESVRAAERVVPTPDGGYALMASDSEVGVEMVCRQVASIGDINGPISRNQLKLLSGADLTLLQSVANALDQASLEVALSHRGRDQEAGQKSGNASPATGQ